MFQPSTPDATASTDSRATLSPASPPSYETVRHMLFGSLRAVQQTIKHLHMLHYAEPNDWSKPIPTGQPNEVVTVLTKKVRVG